MPPTNLESRKANYFGLSGQLAQLGNEQLRALLGDSGNPRGWGATATIVVGHSKIFVKRIPVTQVEYDDMFSTANHFNLPVCYNYGVGSAGFGAFRELAAHVKTTNWVLDGSEPNFPLMYHYRIVPISGSSTEVNEERHQGYVRYWNSDPHIDRYMRERHAAKFHLVLCLEHFPDVLETWLAQNMKGTETIVQEMQRTLAFLRERGIVHFDAHFGNILVNNGIPYLSDFGLLLDKGFVLTKSERAFFNKHSDYDQAEFFACLGSYIFALYQNASEANKKKLGNRYRINEEPSYRELLTLLLDHIEDIKRAGILQLPAYYVSQVVLHRGIIDTMQDFRYAMRENTRKDTPYPQRKLRHLCQTTADGVLSPV